MLGLIPPEGCNYPWSCRDWPSGIHHRGHQHGPFETKARPLVCSIAPSSSPIVRWSVSMATCRTCGTVEPIVGEDDRWRCPSCSRFVAKEPPSIMDDDGPTADGPPSHDEWDRFEDENARLKNELRSARARATSLSSELEPYREAARQKEWEARREFDRTLSGLKEFGRMLENQHAFRASAQHRAPVAVSPACPSMRAGGAPRAGTVPAYQCAGSRCSIGPPEVPRRRSTLPTFD